MSRYSRATCPHCQDEVLVAGTLHLWVHYVDAPADRVRCAGSGLPVDLDDVHLAGTWFRPAEEGAASGC